MINIPNPGSLEAVSKGCTCPVYDNHHGRGWGGDGERYGWVMFLNCPIHGETAKELYDKAVEVKE